MQTPILTQENILPSVWPHIQKQSYRQNAISGVTIKTLTTYTTHDGSFSEILRIQEDHTLGAFPFMQIAQINRSVMLPGVIKAWHLHFAQDEIWNVSSTTHILLGLWDVREQSDTKNNSLLVPMVHNTLVYIPRGVAHGAVNVSQTPGEILYFVSNQYNTDQPDEQRLPWDSLGASFWEMKKE